MVIPKANWYTNYLIVIAELGKLGGCGEGGSISRVF